MASAFISVSGTATPYSGALLSFLRQLQDVVEKSQELKDEADQVALGADWTALAAPWNLSEADAETMYNLLGSANTELHGTFITQLTARAG